MLDLAPDYISASDKSWNALFLNKAGRRMIGFDEDADLKRLDVHEVHPEWVIKLIIEEGTPTAEREGIWRGETAILGKDGQEIPVSQVMLCHRSPGGEIEYYSTICRDITQEKKNREELRKHRDRLEELVQERTAELTKQSEIIKQQAQEILAVSTPVLQVFEGVVVAPLIGTLDSQRTQRFMERLLERIVETNSPVALVDITGVPTIDTQTAQHLIDTISAVKLLGARVILTGVRPAIAQTLVHLGIDLTGITTRSSLASGLLVAMDSLGLRLVAGNKSEVEGD